MYIPESRAALLDAERFLRLKEQEANLFGRSLTEREKVLAYKEYFSRLEVRSDPHKDFAPNN